MRGGVEELDGEEVNRVRTRARACCLSSVKICTGACVWVCVLYACRMRAVRVLYA